MSCVGLRICWDLDDAEALGGPLTAEDGENGEARGASDRDRVSVGRDGAECCAMLTLFRL